MFKSEHDMRQAGTWDEKRQSVTETVCPYCGVGCMLELPVQVNTIVKVTSPLDHSVTSGPLCVKGRFGFEFMTCRRGYPTWRQCRSPLGAVLRYCSPGSHRAASLSNVDAV